MASSSKLKGEKLHFDVSTGLKRVIGRELITDTQVAIFELVKNSFDANAQNVHIYIDSDRIIIIDDGDGMSYQDIREKWLFVAYSSKKIGQVDYRDYISERPFAGSKGVGRFSSDRLGKTLTLQSRPKNESTGLVHRILINWDDFEGNDKRDFGKIDLSYQSADDFEIPNKILGINHGTVLEISGLHENWDRERKKSLKASLTKLINPFGEDIDQFRMTIIAPEEEEEDQKAIEQARAKDPNSPPPTRNIINGPIQNFIFSTLREKTTFVDVTLNNEENYLETRLADRGELVYRIREKNPFFKLANSKLRCQIFYLNTSAKMTFARRIGIPSTQFGHLFLFKNGFRVFPVGEDGDDWWGLARRKQQGYARFLGPREIIGRVDVVGDEYTFQEASSRNQGLIRNDASEALRSFVMKKCIQRLEAYVVPVSWQEKADGHLSDLSLINTDQGRARVAESLANLVEGQDLELLEFSDRLIQVVNERSQQFESSIVNLRTIGEKAGNQELLRNIEKAERRFSELKKAEKEAEAEAEKQRVERKKAEEKREEAEQKAAQAERIAATVTAKYEDTKEENLFLRSVSSLDYDTVINMHHQIILYSSLTGKLASNKIRSYRDKDNIESQDVISCLEQIIFQNQKILAVARFATKANFKLDSSRIETDVPLFIEQYIEEIGQAYLANRIRILVENNASSFIHKFLPIEFSIVIENMISNAKKAGATQITFSMSQPRKNQLSILISDDGRGIDRDILDPEEIFEKGFSKARGPGLRGTGLGLYHVRQTLSEMGGSISVKARGPNDTCFEVRLVK